MSNQESDYQPIDCSFYDRLEEAATLKKPVLLKYWSGKDLYEAKVVIKDILNIGSVEWLVLNNIEKVRLDNIHSVNGVELEKTC